MVTIKKVNRFYRNKESIPKIILSKTDKHEIIYGARAINKQVPKHLRKHTEDYDIYSKTPRRDARQTERALDKKFGGDFFSVKPAVHPGTYRVNSNINKVTYADYTDYKDKIPFKTIQGKKYVDLEYIKKGIRKTLKDDTAKFRHEKDRDALRRIQAGEKAKKRKRIVKKKGLYNRIDKEMGRMFR